MQMKVQLYNLILLVINKKKLQIVYILRRKKTEKLDVNNVKIKVANFLKIKRKIICVFSILDLKLKNLKV